MKEATILRDVHHASVDTLRDIERSNRGRAGFIGFGSVVVRDGDNQIVQVEPFSNLVTDAGDLYCAGKLIQGIAPAAPAAPTPANGMKLGTGTTVVTKSGVAAALITYLSASQQAFDATYPQTSNLGAGLGVVAVYRTLYAAGTATNAALTEAVIVNDAATNATSAAAATYSRTVFGAINKGASDTLTITWQWKQLGV